MRLANPSLFSSYRWYEWYPTALIAQHPSAWRFLAYGQFRGTSSLGIPSLTTWTAGYGVFDWDYVTNRYELTRFDPTPDYWGYTAVFSNVAFAWVSDTVVRIVGSPVGDSGGDNVRHAGKFSVSPGGNFSWIQTTETHCGYDLVNKASFYGGWAVGYNGGIVYPYADATYTEPYPTANCYIGKITDTNTATNLGPLRSAGDARGSHAALALLGPTAAGNGYAFGTQSCSMDSLTQTVYAAVYNISAGTPYVQCALNYSGSPSNLAPIRIGARKILVSEPSPGLKQTLLYTDSDTSPTTLTRGQAVLAPTLPFTPDRVGYAYFLGGGMNAQNFWVREGLAAGVAVYAMLPSDYADGETYKYRYIPVKFVSSGPSDLSVSALTTDISGAAFPVETVFSSDSQVVENYAFQFVGAPGAKAAFFWKLGGAPRGTTQTIFQL